MALNSIEIVRNKDYQSLFSDSFIFEGGRFVENTTDEKSGFLFPCASDPISLEHNKLINESFLFYKWDTGALFLLLSKSHDHPDIFFYVDSECSVYAVGTNPFNYASNFGNSIIDIHKVTDKERFFTHCQSMFGEFERHFPESKAEHYLYRQYPELY